MNYVDIILGIPLLWGLIRGFGKGLFVSLASLIALVAGIYFAVHFSHIVGDYLQQQFSWNDNTIRLTAFAITFIIVVILVSLAGKILTKIADFAALGLLNKLLGAAFGFLKFAFIASVLIMFVDAGNKSLRIIKQDTLTSSVLYAPIKKLAPMLLPKILKKDTSESTDTSE